MVYEPKVEGQGKKQIHIREVKENELILVSILWLKVFFFKV